MELTEDEIIEKYANIVDIVIKTHYYHTNMNLFAFHVDIMF